MIESLITSKTRIKLLLKFFLNSQSQSYLRCLANEFGESTNAIRLELNHMEKAGLLEYTEQGNKKIFFANTNHPLMSDIHNILIKYIGIDQIIKQIIGQIDTLEAAYLSGELAMGRDSKLIELILVGNVDNPSYVESLIQKTEVFINRKISYTINSREEIDQCNDSNPTVLIWEASGETVENNRNLNN